MVVSAVVLDELVTAPDAVRLFFNGMLEYIEVLEPSEEADALQRAYLEAGVLSSSHERDAFHVASATVSGCVMIVRPAGAAPA